MSTGSLDSRIHSLAKTVWRTRRRFMATVLAAGLLLALTAAAAWVLGGVILDLVLPMGVPARVAIWCGWWGVVVLAAMQQGIEVSELAPAEVKRAVAGRGNATKEQVRRAVMAQCGLRSMRGPSDVSDAIAIALCAARRAGALR